MKSLSWCFHKLLAKHIADRGDSASDKHVVDVREKNRCPASRSMLVGLRYEYWHRPMLWNPVITKLLFILIGLFTVFALDSYPYYLSKNFNKSDLVVNEMRVISIDPSERGPGIMFTVEVDGDRFRLFTVESPEEVEILKESLGKIIKVGYHSAIPAGGVFDLLTKKYMILYLEIEGGVHVSHSQGREIVAALSGSYSLWRFALIFLICAFVSMPVITRVTKGGL